MAAVFVTGTPPQVQADDNQFATVLKTHPGGAVNHTETLTLAKRTPKGTNGSMTLVNGVVTAYTAPT